MSKILFLFEGSDTEPGIFEATVPVMLPDSNFVRSGKGVVCVYGTHIYTLYSRLKSDPGLDLVGLLMEHPDKYPALRDALADTEVSAEAFEAIYLLFDYDGHVNMPRTADGSHLEGDAALKEMFDFFDDASENGKLLISYPMVEAIKHLSAEPSTHHDIVTAKCKGPHCPNSECPDRHDRSKCPKVREYYKGLVNNLHPHRCRTADIKAAEWAGIFMCHLKVGQLICGLTDSLPSQQSIFNSQIRNFISRRCPQVAVLSGFPYLYADYLGFRQLLTRLTTI